MNGRPLTDAQISSALRAHVPERAQAGLRERILEAAGTTTQQRALPSFLGALGDADTFARRRGLLIAAALLVALALASVAAVGALRLLQRDPVRDLSLEHRPTLQGVVAPSSTPSLPSDGPTSSAFPRPTGVWIATGMMGTPRDGSTAVVRLLDGRVLVAGGSGANNENDLTSAELYDPDSGTWSATGNMLKPHGGFPATLLRDGKVLVGDVVDPTVDDWILGAELYDPATGTWSSTGELVITGVGGYSAGTTATLLRDGKVLVAGDNGAQLYDPASGTWSATGKMITPRHHHTATLLPDGTVLVAGGDVGDGMVYSAELYDPDTGSWTAIANTRNGGPCRSGCPRGGGMATLLQDGTLLFMRRSSSVPVVEFVEIYDPATGTWTRTGDMARPDAAYATATPLLDGTVLVAGQSGPDARGLAEVYDPATGSWTETRNMLYDIFYDSSSATLLLDGTVLVAGGGGSFATGAASSAELYIPAGLSPPPAVLALPIPIPTPTPTLVPTPIPTPFPPAAGPVPAGARSWTVRVVNRSSNPATLFLAEDGENGIGPLCGSVTPNVVPAGVTQKVIFLLPPKRVKSCWIWVNPVPGQGGSLFQTSDAPLAGEVFIQAEGQGGWLSP
jgi:hypothetical protein